MLVKRTYTRRQAGALLGAGLAALFLSGAPRAGDAPRTHKIDIQKFKFAPAALTIKAGDSVEWTNHDIAPHTATHEEGSWDTGTLSRGESAAQTFETPGTYSYFCAFHPQMTGTLTVEA